MAANNGSLFCKHFFHIFQEKPPALRVVRALVIDTKMRIPGTGISIRPSHKNQGHFKQYTGFLHNPIKKEDRERTCI